MSFFDNLINVFMPKGQDQEHEVARKSNLVEQKSDLSHEEFSAFQTDGHRHAAPEQFLKGVGLSVWQTSPDPFCNWSHFGHMKGHFVDSSSPEKPFVSSNFWKKYPSIINLAADMGCTSFYLTIEWSRIQPHGPDTVDHKALQKYAEILDVIVIRKLAPIISLHHCTHPKWFEDKGGFEVAKNEAYFVAYAKTVFSALGSKRVTLWATFTEAAAGTVQGYVTGGHPPGNVMEFTRVGKILFHMMRAHCKVYIALKKMRGGNDIQIGFIHRHQSHTAATSTATAFASLYLNPVCEWLNYFYSTDVLMHFFKTGVFQWKVPVWGMVLEKKITDAPNYVDWWGVNYFGSHKLGWQLSSVIQSGDLVDDTNMCMDAPGFLDSLRVASKLNRPIYVTSLGFASIKPMIWQIFLVQHYDMLMRAFAEGIDVRGVLHWSLIDGVSWEKGVEKGYGFTDLVKLERYERESAAKSDPKASKKQGGKQQQQQPESPVKDELPLRECARLLVLMFASWPNTCIEAKQKSLKHLEKEMRAKDEEIQKLEAKKAPPVEEVVADKPGKRKTVLDVLQPEAMELVTRNRRKAHLFDTPITSKASTPIHNQASAQGNGLRSRSTLGNRGMDVEAMTQPPNKTDLGPRGTIRPGGLLLGDQNPKSDGEAGTPRGQRRLDADPNSSRNRRTRQSSAAGGLDPPPQENLNKGEGGVPQSRTMPRMPEPLAPAGSEPSPPLGHQTSFGSMPETRMGSRAERSAGSMPALQGPPGRGVWGGNTRSRMGNSVSSMAPQKGGEGGAAGANGELTLADSELLQRYFNSAAKIQAEESDVLAGQADKRGLQPIEEEARSSHMEAVVRESMELRRANVALMGK